ncbi:MAG: glycosyltransferase family 39 protein, partial [Halobacteriales archaeon]|nr:glycosyltransferase family 39 protein [Halobacteriales archaeon]
MVRLGGQLNDWVGTRIHENRLPLLALLIAVGSGLLVFFVAHDLFPYHSSNHDEGVYLQQAAMLLEGQLFLTPGSEPLREAVHPWFFVESDRGFYAKYAPVPAAVFALGKLLGGYRLALLGVAVTVVGLTYVLSAAAFDRPTGVLAAVILAASPLFLLTSAVFLPYAPTTALNLLFAVAYVRSVRQSSIRYSVLAGVAIGLAFFARPYTAVLFATPFILHACWHLHRNGLRDRITIQRTGTIAGIGLVFVGITLAYNLVLTGSAFQFPYEAFAPRDGLGFGRREILGYERVYTPVVALQTTIIVLKTFAVDWFTAGILGTATAVLGGG